MQALILLIAAMATGQPAPSPPTTAHPAPSRIKTGSNVADWIGDTVRPLGIGLPLVLYATGDYANRRAARQIVNAEALALLVSEGLKRLTHEPRPRQPDASDGFPSGHAAAAWAMATVVAHDYPEHSGLAYAYAAAVTWSRRGSRWHTWAQALAGSFVGWLAGRIELNQSDGLFIHVPPENQLQQHSSALAPASPIPGTAAYVILWKHEF